MAKPNTLTVVYGEEEFLLDRAIDNTRALWKSQKRSVSLLNGEYITEGRFLSLCETQSIFEDDLKGVILDNAQELKHSKRLGEFFSSRNPQDQSLAIALIFRAASLSKGWSEITKAGVVIQHPKFKPWETDKVYKRTIEEAKTLELRLGKGVPELLYKVLGDNLRSVVNELKKLQYLVGSGGVVECKHVATVVSPDFPVEPWQVAEAALSKDFVRAMNIISMLNTSMGDGFLVPVTVSLQKQVEKMLVVRQMLDKGDAVSTIAAAMGKSEFFCQKNIIPLARKHSVRELLTHMNTLCKLEPRVKGAARSKRTLVELAVLSIAA